MAYASVTSILNIVPGLPQTTTSAGYSETTLVVNRHITRADGLINSYLSKRYSVPISPTPPLLASISEDVTVYYAYRSFYMQDNFNQMKYFDELKKTALDTLKDIMNGEINLVNTAGSVIAESTTEDDTFIDSTTKDYTPAFNVDDVFNWKFDDDLLDSIDDDRD